MAQDLTHFETPKAKLKWQQGTTPNGHTWYKRYYHAPPQQADALMAAHPAGTVIPGMTLVVATPLLGPYIRSIYKGKLVDEDGGMKIEIIIEGRLFAADT